ncbi:MAG: radical SAM protein [Myxococcota bacterium]
MTSLRGRVFDLQRFCVHDGPGIRTTVFLAGCPLRCAWCHNPEAFAGESAAWRTPEEVLREVLADRDFYSESGGGLTVSGGEPLLQPEFVRALLDLAGRAGLHRCVQTAGAVPWSAFEAVTPVVDLFQFDLKHLDPERHRALTGQGNELILANAARLMAQGAPVEFRLPLVPGLNDDPAHLDRVAEFLRARGVARLRIVPYQGTYLGKYRTLGLEAKCAGTRAPTAEQLAAVTDRFSARRVELAIDG